MNPLLNHKIKKGKNKKRVQIKNKRYGKKKKKIKKAKKLTKRKNKKSQ